MKNPDIYFGFIEGTLEHADLVEYCRIADRNGAMFIETGMLFRPNVIGFFVLPKNEEFEKRRIDIRKDVGEQKWSEVFGEDDGMSVYERLKKAQKEGLVTCE